MNSTTAIRSSVGLAVREIVERNKLELSGDWWQGRPEMWVGALTNTVARKLCISQSRARYTLTKLEQSGALIAHRTRGGITRWYPSSANAQVSDGCRQPTHDGTKNS